MLCLMCVITSLTHATTSALAPHLTYCKQAFPYSPYYSVPGRRCRGIMLYVVELVNKVVLAMGLANYNIIAHNMSIYGVLLSQCN